MTLLGILLAAIAGGLILVSRRFAANPSPAIEAVEQLLPQTQCGQCGYPGCRPYAEAIIANRAPINLCPPGGESTVRALAELLCRPSIALNASSQTASANIKAVIDEDACIGCARCLQACPVDAILGAPQHMHTVIRDECTGCELCIAPCPVDCISLQPSG